jgi:ABC-type lipoprotein release transport system permease subunit
MRRVLDILWAGVQAAARDRLSSGIIAATLVAVLLPYLAALGIAAGIHDDTREALHGGADLIVTPRRFGKPCPAPLELGRELGMLTGVRTAIPRIVGEVQIGREPESVILVGLPPEFMPDLGAPLDGRPPRTAARHEMAVSAALAHRLQLRVGSLIPPFYRNDRGERVSEVVAVFHPDGSLGQVNLVVTTLADAALIFEQPDNVTDWLLVCDPAAAADVRRGVRRLRGHAPDGGVISLDARTPAEWLTAVELGVRERTGIVSLHWALLLVAAVLVVLVSAGAGAREQRRALGILKATGWQTDEILMMRFAQSFSQALVSWLIAVAAAWVWLRLGNGVWIAGWFLTDVDFYPGFTVPFRLAPLPACIALLLAVVIVLSGSWFSAWRAAITPPREAMR